MVSDRIALISAELNKLKMDITRLSIMAMQTEVTVNELRRNRRAAQLCTRDLEDLIQLASPDTLAAYHLRAWAQFVGKIWSPMVNLLFFNENPLSKLFLFDRNNTLLACFSDLLNALTLIRLSKE